MSKLNNLHDFFKDLADAIRKKEGSVNSINPQDMAVRIAAIMGKEFIKRPRATLRELLKDIADSIRLAEGSDGKIYPQDMSTRVLALIEEIYLLVTPEIVWLTESNNYTSNFNIYSNTNWFVEKEDTQKITEVEYIQSTSAQYIDTQYIPNTNTEIEIKISGISADSFALSSSSTWFFGGRQGYLNNAFGSYYNQSTQTLYYAFGKSMPYAKFTNMYGDNKVLKANATGIYVNDVKVVSMTSNNFTSPCPLTLFALNNNGSAISFTSYKLHYCKIWDNGELIRDFIPVLDTEGIACLYDRISNNFFYNQGTGNFISGNIITK